MVLGNIKKYTTELKEQFKERIAVIGDAPKLAIIQVGNIEASNRYIKNKVKDCEEVGIVADVYQYPEEQGMCRSLWHQTAQSLVLRPCRLWKNIFCRKGGGGAWHKLYESSTR